MAHLMMTGKQRWRRLKTRKLRENDLWYKMGLGQDNTHACGQSISESSYLDGVPGRNMARSWKTTGDLYVNSTTTDNKYMDSTSRKVSFSKCARTVLIPTRNEYDDLGLKSVLWWTDSDYRNFRQSIFDEAEIKTTILEEDIIIIDTISY